MSNAVKKEVFQRPHMRELGKDELAPKPCLGARDTQILNASGIVFARYYRMFQRLSKM